MMCRKNLPSLKRPDVSVEATDTADLYFLKDANGRVAALWLGKNPSLEAVAERMQNALIAMRYARAA